MELDKFIEELASKEPVPGGGGASALIGAVGIALCSMAANLTSGKPKYAEYQKDIEIIISRSGDLIKKLLKFIERDAEVFEPLSKAYSIPKDNPGRDDVLESALVLACSVPLDIMREIENNLDIIEQLSEKGSKLMMSDVGVAAAACRSAIEGAAMNVYVNTKLMKDREAALKTNEETQTILFRGIERCDKIYKKILGELCLN